MNTNFWNQVPLFRFLPFFIAGIATGISFHGVEMIPLLSVSLIPFAVLSLLYFFPKRFSTYRFRWLFGLAGYVLFYLFGWCLTILNTETNYTEHFSHSNAKEYIGFVETPLKEKGKTVRTVIQITSVKENEWRKSMGSCLAYIEKDSSSANLKYGDLIYFNNAPGEVLPVANPGQFDYKRWLAYNKIYNQVYLASDKWTLLDHHCGNWLQDYAFSLRERMLSMFRKYDITNQDYAVLSALTLGYENDIDQEITSAYAASGALHVLSVSGLHVGIIYFVLNLFLKFMDRRRKTKILKAGIIILFLWFYALLTGLSPAVLRSVAMLSFIVIGTVRTQPANMYNTLFASAMVLLILNPYLLMQVGFQLSFMAVLGIAFLQPAINKWYDSPNWIARQVWSITSVSIAAQTATFPLGLLYFHQFPIYFILSNLIIIPLTNFIIFGGIFLLVFSGIPVVAKIPAAATGGLVHFVNSTVILIEHLPNSLIKGISISLLETWLIYLLILGFVLYLMTKELPYLFASLSFIIILLSFQIAESFNDQSQQQMIVYSIPKKSAIGFIDNGQCVFIADSGLINNKKMMQFSIYNHWWDNGIDESKVKYWNDSSTTCLQCNNIMLQNHFIEFAGRKILHFDNSALLNYSAEKMKFDFVILSDNLKVSLADLIRKFDAHQIIIDSSNSFYKTSKWLKEAEQLHISCYSVLQKGAFIFNARTSTD